jgi:hypothetical protein
VISPIEVCKARDHIDEFMLDRFDQDAISCEWPGRVVDEEEDIEVLSQPPKVARAEAISPTLPSTDLCTCNSSEGLSIGIRNQGNTCYLAVSIQVLLHFPSERPFAELLPESQDPLIGAYKHFAEEYAQGREGDLQPILTWLAQYVTDVHAMHDASEVLHMLLETFVGLSDSVAHLIQTTVLDTTLNGDESQVQSQRILKLIKWDIPVSGYHNLDSAITGLFSSHTWQNSDTGQSGTSQYTVIELPQIVIMTLGLFTYDNGHTVKVNNRLPVALSLDLGKFVHGINLTKSYTLSGLIVHTGGAENGHYVYAFLHEDSTMWTVYDDFHVTDLAPIDDIFVIGQNCAAYVLIYAETNDPD